MNDSGTVSVLEVKAISRLCVEGKMRMLESFGIEHHNIGGVGGIA